MKVFIGALNFALILAAMNLFFWPVPRGVGDWAVLVPWICIITPAITLLYLFNTSEAATRFGPLEARRLRRERQILEDQQRIDQLRQSDND